MTAPLRVRATLDQAAARARPGDVALVILASADGSRAEVIADPADLHALPHARLLLVEALVRGDGSGGCACCGSRGCACRCEMGRMLAPDAED